MKTLIVCASRYGATMEIGRWIADRLPWKEIEVVSVTEDPDPSGFELVFLGGGVYNEKSRQTNCSVRPKASRGARRQVSGCLCRLPGHQGSLHEGPLLRRVAVPATAFGCPLRPSPALRRRAFRGNHPQKAHRKGLQSADVFLYQDTKTRHNRGALPNVDGQASGMGLYRKSPAPAGRAFLSYAANRVLATWPK